MADIKEERGADGVTGGFRGKHSLRSITTAARFRPWIPRAPPLDGKGRHEEGYYRHRIVKIGEKRKLLRNLLILQKLVQSPYYGKVDRNDCGDNATGHRDNKQHEISPKHCGKAADRREEDRRRTRDENRR